MHQRFFALVFVLSSGVGCAGPVDDGRVVVRGGVPDDVAAVVDTGFVSGRICNAHVGAYLVGARVSVVDDDGVLAETVTDDDGAFALEVETGVHAVVVAGDGFQKTFVADVLADVDVSVQNDAVCEAE